MTPTIGIAIPAYGRGRHLRATLESVLAQTRPAKEIIVVDDVSPDETGEVAKSFSSAGVVYHRNEKNLGVPANLNEALSRTTTDYVMILEDHDILEPRFLEECAGLLDQHHEMTMATSDTIEIDEKTGEEIRVIRREFPTVQPVGDLARRILTTLVSPVTVVNLIRRAALSGLEPWFDPKYWWYADLHLWIRLSMRGTVGYVHQPLMRLRGREDGHFLHDKPYQTLTCIDRIARDDWSLVYPSRSIEHYLARMSYVLHRDNSILRMALWHMLRGQKEAPPEIQSRVSLPAALALRGISVMPIGLAKVLRDIAKTLYRSKDPQAGRAD